MDVWLTADWLGVFKKLAVYMLGMLAEAIRLLVWLKALQLLETAALCGKTFNDAPIKRVNFMC